MADPPQPAEHGDAAVAVGSSVSPNRDDRPCKIARRLRMRPTNIDCISDSLLFEVLVHLPAQELYEWARFVCWKWYLMIHTHSFMYAHLQCTTSGFIIQSPRVLSRPMFVSFVTRRGRIEISKLDYKLTCPIQTAWNGLIAGFKPRESIFILNPATKQHYSVPRFDGYLQQRHDIGIAYSASSMEYKVVLADSHKRRSGYQLYILTVGVDKSWRHIGSGHLSPEANKLFCHRPLITKGFVHWTTSSSYCVVTLNVETEILTETSVPLPFGEEKRRTFYMSTGSYLSLLIACGMFSWDVWEMKPQTGEWTKLYNLDLEAQNCRFEQVGLFEPRQWFNYHEMLFFYGSRLCAVYNLRTREILSVKLPYFFGYDTVYTSHRNSLVWMK